MKRKSMLLTILIPFLVLFHGQAFADDGEEDNGGNGGSHHIALFLGFTTSNVDTEHSHTDFSLGIDYEYRIPLLFHIIGIGLFGEMVLAEHTEYLLGIPLVVHPLGGLKLLLAPGLAIADIGEIESRFLLRGGIGYDIHILFLSITPSLSMDFIEEHLSLVYGVGIGVGF